VVTECEPLVVVYHEAMWDVHIEPLALLNTLVQLLGSNIITYVTHSTLLSLLQPGKLGAFLPVPAGHFT